MSKHSPSDVVLMNKEIFKLLTQGAISQCYPCEGQFVSSTFLVDKPNGGKRFILNLKALNVFIRPFHFKMEDYRTALKLISKDCLMTKIDLENAYFLVPIEEKFRKYLRFYFKNILYEFNVLPFGLSIAPYIFTKLLKPALSFLRQNGITCVAYIDDFLLIADNHLHSQLNTAFTLSTLESLGFLINHEKSSLVPNTTCKFLGFILNSSRMTIELPEDKRKKVNSWLLMILGLKKIKIRRFAQFLGLLISVCPAFKYAKLYTRIFEREKFLALKAARNNNYNETMILSNCLKKDLEWWQSHIFSDVNYIVKASFDFEIYTDASKTGWGAVCKNMHVHGWWSPSEQKLHINSLELTAIFLALKYFATDLKSKSILLRVDNTTALSCVNKMGSIQYESLNSIVREIWQFCEARDIWIFASYVQSKNNLADEDSRKLSEETEWELSQVIFKIIIKNLGEPDIDIFASRSNHKCVKYISWKWDPEAVFVDAFTVSWKNLNFYAFPPFALILRVLNKIVVDKAEGILVVPHWPSQPWFPLFTKLLLGKPIKLGPDPNMLSSPFRATHPMAETLTLVAGKLSGELFN